MQGEVSATVTEAEMRLEPTVVGGSSGLEKKTRKDKNDTSWNVLREDKVDPPIHTEYFHSGGATTMSFIVNEANEVNSLIMRSPAPWNMDAAVLRRSTSLFVVSWKEVSLASSPMKLGWNNASAQQKGSSPTVMMFSVWEYVGRITVRTFRLSV